MSTTRSPLSTSDALNQSVQYLKGVGPARADTLKKLGITTVGELLFHFPRSFDDLSDVRPIKDLVAGKTQTVQGEVVEMIGKELADGRTITSVVLSDGSPSCLEGIWFNRAFATRNLRYGQKLAFSGKPKWHYDHWQMNTPRVQSLDGAEMETSVVPVYPLTDGLYADQLRKILQQAVDGFAALAPEVIPEELRTRRKFSRIEQALRELHFPKDLPQALNARRRFVFEEFFVLQVALALRRREMRDRQQAPKLPVTRAIDEHIRKLYPFKLTGDQNRVIVAVCKDLASERPMQRLLQADVGAGKTAVAVYALLVTVANKHQAALMAPTEVLARQHWHTLQQYLEHSRVRRVLLTGSLTTKERQQTLEKIRSGDIDLVIGTQALVQEDVQFAQLGLVVIDEQHKFGVEQRARIRRLGVDPHYLVMTATPIPRTVALTVFGDLDISTMRELPPGRQPVKTRWENEGQRERIYQHLRDEVRQGRQAYFVYPLVEESSALDVKAAEQMHKELRDGPFKEFRIGLLHGRLDDKVKDAEMERFRKHELDILVSTVAIEVGVDVPNATLMVIEHAERFGLSQLHQLRGRVSRGPVAGECFLFTGVVSEEARERLRSFTRTKDGFALAELDARMRGLGEFFGTRQHGLGELAIADMLNDQDVLREARQDAFELAAADANLSQPDHAPLRQAVLRKYGKTLDLAEIG